MEDNRTYREKCEGALQTLINLRKEKHKGGYPFMYSWDDDGNFWLEYPDGRIDHCSGFDKSYKPVVIRTLSNQQAQGLLKEQWGEELSIG